MPAWPSTAEAWPGCHGVRLGPAALAAGFGRSRGEPLLDATLTYGAVRLPGPRTLWHLTTEVETRRGPYTVDQRLTEHDDGVLTIHTTDGALEVSTNSLVCEAGSESLRRQLVTTFGLPLLVQRGPVLILHACAAVPPGAREVLAVCAASGGGKSTLLTGLIARGWSAVSEDVCVIDLRSDEPRVWPGPPWVRTASAIDARARFAAGDKTAWDIEAHQADEPLPLRRVLFMEAPGDEKRSVLATKDAIARAAPHVMWLGAPADRAQATFAKTVDVMASVEASVLRVPRAEDWTARAEALLR
jgi:hypothetical protein